MGPDETHPEDEGLPTGEHGPWERPYGTRPYGTRPYGTRPYGTRPYGTRPYGTRPYGTRPYGTRPYGTRPYGTRPYGTRPYGTRPYGTRPYGTRPYGARPYVDDVLGGGQFDPGEWGAEIAELVCERSAVIRLGATLMFADDELQVPVSNTAAGFRAPGAAGPVPGVTPSIALRPGDWRLEASVTVPIRLFHGLAASPDLASTLKVDLAEALALWADQAFLLEQAAVGGPEGISDLVAGTPPAAGGGQLLQRLRNMASGVRAVHPVRNPGWILHPRALDDIAEFLTRNGVLGAPAQGRAVDTFPLLKYDGADGGILLGFPFVTSAAALRGNRRRVYFSADWEEAWIGLDPYFVTVAVPGASAAAGAPAASGDVVITASMPLDFILRRAPAFAWTVSG